MLEHCTTYIEKKPHVCQLCRMLFREESELTAHELTHHQNFSAKLQSSEQCEKPFQCHKGKKRLSKRVDFEKHTNIFFFFFKKSHWYCVTHSAERPFKCDQCDGAFSTEVDLQRHFLVHSEDPLAKGGF